MKAPEVCATASAVEAVDAGASGIALECAEANATARGRAGFAAAVVRWQRLHGRHDLPWQGSRDPYRIWLSEVMLQQTQVSTVIPYFRRFVERFPDVASLARAPLDEVMRLWSGLGYYSRARNLHRCAREVLERHGGQFPLDSVTLAGLPGIGRSTAAAIAAFSAGERVAILDGNVRRVLCRVFGVEGWPGERQVETRLWQIAERELPETAIEAYTQGLMDLGATVCTRARPACERCPVRDRCVALREQAVARLPSPRPKRQVPLRRCRMFALRGPAGWLVEKRPAAGIWGGLWSLPQSEPLGVESGDIGRVDRADGDQGRVDSAGSLAQAAQLAAGHGLRISSAFESPGFVHTFTHFRLAIEPVVCEVVHATAVTAPGTAWLPDADLAEAALPQPVKQLLLRESERWVGRIAAG
jgi:A/G-specific adenine glycosylase